MKAIRVVAALDFALVGRSGQSFLLFGVSKANERSAVRFCFLLSIQLGLTPFKTVNRAPFTELPLRSRSVLVRAPPGLAVTFVEPTIVCCAKSYQSWNYARSSQYGIRLGLGFGHKLHPRSV